MNLFSLSLFPPFPLLPSRLSHFAICFPSVPPETILRSQLGKIVAWRGEGSKRVSDCPLGDEAKGEREEEEGEKGRLIAPASNSTAGCHPWLGGGVWCGGTGDASLMLQCLLTQQTQQGAFHPGLAALAQLKTAHKNRCHVNEPTVFYFTG